MGETREKRHHGYDAGTGGHKLSLTGKEMRSDGTQRRCETGQPTSHHNPPGTTHKKEEERGKEEEGGGEGGRRGGKSPARGREQTARKARGAANRIRGTSQDCTRVFPVKGAADALCNPEANILRGVGSMATGRAGFRRNPSHNAPKGLGPPTTASLQNERAEGGTTLGNTGSRVLEGPFALLNVMKNICHRGGSRGEVGGPEQRRDRKIPGFRETRNPPGDPDVSREATGGRRNRGKEGGIIVQGGGGGLPGRAASAGGGGWASQLRVRPTCAPPRQSRRHP